MQHRGITLRQITEDDMPFLFRLFAAPERSHLWMRCRDVFDEREFYHAWSAWTAEMIAAKFLVERDGQPLGLVYDYKRTLEDGHTKVTALLTESRTGGGYGVIATAMLVDWLFRSLPFRKVYMDVYDYNPKVAEIVKKAGFVEEAVLKEDRFRDGQYWNLHVLAVYRDGWPAVRTRILGRESPEEPTASRPKSNGKTQLLQSTIR
jgi:RimJ/RimL family protein N-acetyltransferase